MDAAAAKLLQSCLTLCNSIDSSPRTDESGAKRTPTPLAKCQVASPSLYINIKLCHPVILLHNDGKAGSGDHLLPVVINLLQPQRAVAGSVSLLLSGSTWYYSEVPLPCGQAGESCFMSLPSLQS